MKREYFLTLATLPLMITMIVAGHYFYDLPVTDFLTGLDPQAVSFFQIVTALGVSTWYLIGSAVCFVYFFYVAVKKTWAHRALYLFCAVAVSGIVANILKWLMGRWRPKLYQSDGLYGFEFFGSGYEQTSFPSGHATTICSLAFVLSVFFPYCRWLWTSIAVLVCLSRVVIGAHYLSDVMMGAYIGILIAFLLRKGPLIRESTRGGLSY